MVREIQTIRHRSTPFAGQTSGARGFELSLETNHASNLLTNGWLGPDASDPAVYVTPSRREFFRLGHESCPIRRERLQGCNRIGKDSEPFVRPFSPPIALKNSPRSSPEEPLSSESGESSLVGSGQDCGEPSLQFV